MSEIKQCPKCNAPLAEGVAFCSYCGASGPTPTIFGSTTKDGWLGGLAMLLVGGALITGGILVGIQGDNKAWLIPASFGLTLAIGLAALFGVRGRSRSMSLGVAVALTLVLFNPLSLCFGLLGLLAIFGA